MRRLRKPNIRNVLIILLVISIAYNFSMYYKDRHFINQKQSQHQRFLRAISASGENLAERLEEFLQHSNENATDEVEELLENSWRITFGESRSIRFYLAGITPHYMGKLESKWSLLQYSLIRVDDFLYGLNINFLKQKSYFINDEETEKLKAVIVIYKKIYEAVKSGSDHPELVIDSLTEQMMIIDDHYSSTLERVKSN